MASPYAIPGAINTIANQSDSVNAPSAILQAIKTAAQKTGVDFSYLLHKAVQESGLDSTAKSSTSSATGLFQFTGQTWLEMIKNFGAQYGLGDAASQITAKSNGHLTVADSATKKQILALRNDPTLSAEMAAELDKQNAASLKSTVGGKIGATELYLAHFLGAGGASDFISSMRDNPNAAAADVVPSAAEANQSVFYTKSGEPRTLAQIYHHFAQKFSTGITQMASATPNPQNSATPAVTATSTASEMTVASLATPPQSLRESMQGLANVQSVLPTTTTLPASATGLMTRSTSSTLFAAMMLGQNSGGIDPSAALDMLNRDGKKKDGAAEQASLA
ncbi:MAG: transglycosylase SLT domain-containing protein [Alphaproteobacteria bacterium]|nr:transglycosylase SLT domain-containing protein [Alphaproteobacteria bacterium]